MLRPESSCEFSLFSSGGLRPMLAGLETVQGVGETAVQQVVFECENRSIGLPASFADRPESISKSLWLGSVPANILVRAKCIG